MLLFHWVKKHEHMESKNTIGNYTKFIKILNLLIFFLKFESAKLIKTLNHFYNNHPDKILGVNFN